MDRNYHNYGNRPQRNPNVQPNPNVQQNQSHNIVFDPSMLANPQFQVMFQSFLNQNISTQELPQQSHYNLSPPPRVLFPMSQNIDQYPTTPGGDGSSNRTPTEEYYPSQEVDEDGGEEDAEEYEAEQIMKGKSKVTKERWGKEEDKVLVSGYLNCGGDPEEGTDQTKAKLWREIKRIYDTEADRRPNIIHARTMKSIKKRWTTINECVTLWVSQLGEAERMRMSGMAIENVEDKAHDLYNQKKKGKSFMFYHCWVVMKHLPRWMPGKDSTIVSQGSSKRSSDDAGIPRPDGVKKAKAQRKLKTTNTSLDEFNATLSGMQSSRGTLQKQISDLIEYQKVRDEKKYRFKMFSLLMAKPHLEPQEAEYFERLKEEFMK